MLAGLIGLGLVVIYSLFQYRALGLVTILSLVIAGVITYLAIVLLGWAENYRLSLAGVAGIIVAIGQTADSFIVYFERVRDELRDGRGLIAAVENGWAAAKRTILASKAVNLLAAVVLYFVSVGNVKGFAFTLGLTAVADLIVVFMFTHPTLQLLARTKFFGEGHRFSGLDPVQLGAIPLYRGAGRFRTPEETLEVAKGKNARAAGEAERRQTIAERRLAAKEAELVGSRGAGAAKSESSDDSKEKQVMKSFATFGNELYTGERSYEFVGKRKIWFAITGIAVAALPPDPHAGRRLQLRHRVPRRLTVHHLRRCPHGRAIGEEAVAEAVPGTAAVVTNIAGNTMQVQTDRLTDDETLKVKDALKSAYGVTEDHITSTFVGPTWGAGRIPPGHHRLHRLCASGNGADGPVLPHLAHVHCGSGGHAGGHGGHGRRLRGIQL